MLTSVGMGTKGEMPGTGIQDPLGRAMVPSDKEKQVDNIVGAANMGELQVKLIAQQLIRIKQNGKFGVDTCLSLKDIWQSCRDLELTAKWDMDTLMLLMEVTVNCIFGGGWVKLPQVYKSEMVDCIHRESYTLEQDDRETSKEMQRFRRMCEGLSYLVQNDVWFPPYLEKIYNSTELAPDMEAVDELWNKEDFLFIKVRIEKLCLANELTKALALVNATIQKFQPVHDPKDGPTSSASSSDLEDVAISAVDYTGFGAMYILLSVKLERDLLPVVSLFTCPAQQRIAVLLRDETNAIAPKWKKGWKYKNSAAQAWMEKVVFDLIKNPLDPHPDKSSLMWGGIVVTTVTWLEFAQIFNKEKYECGQNRASKTHLYNLASSVEENLTEEDKTFLNTIPVEVIDQLSQKVAHKSYLLCFAAALKEQFGKPDLGIAIRSKCIQLCLAALLHDVNALERLKLRESSSKDCNDIVESKEQQLALQYQELSAYLQQDAATRFEVILTSFSLNPTQGTFEELKLLAKKRSIEEMKKDPQHEFSQDDNNWNWSSIVWECVSSRKALELGISEVSFQTLITVLTNSRLTNFNTIQPSWSFYEPLCLHHLKTRGSEIKGPNNLELARPDYSKFTYEEEKEMGDDMIFEAGFEPVSDEEPEKNQKGKPLRTKEPASRLRQLKSAEALKSKENNFKNFRPKPTIRKKRPPNLPKRRYIRQSTSSLTRREPNIPKVISKSASADLRPQNEAGFTEKFAFLTLASTSFDIFKILDTSFQSFQEGEKLKLPVSALLAKLSTEKEESRVANPEQKAPQMESNRKRTRYSDTRRASFNSQRKTDQPHINDFNFNAFNNNVAAVIGKRPVNTDMVRPRETTGNMRIFSHLFPSNFKMPLPVASKQSDDESTSVTKITKPKSVISPGTEDSVGVMRTVRRQGETNTSIEQPLPLSRDIETKALNNDPEPELKEVDLSQILNGETLTPEFHIGTNVQPMDEETASEITVLEPTHTTQPTTTLSPKCAEERNTLNSNRPNSEPTTLESQSRELIHNILKQGIEHGTSSATELNDLDDTKDASPELETCLLELPENVHESGRRSSLEDMEALIQSGLKMAAADKDTGLDERPEDADGQVLDDQQAMEVSCVSSNIRINQAEMNSDVGVPPVQEERVTPEPTITSETLCTPSEDVPHLEEGHSFTESVESILSSHSSSSKDQSFGTEKDSFDEPELEAGMPYNIIPLISDNDVEMQVPESDIDPLSLNDADEVVVEIDLTSDSEENKPSTHSTSAKPKEQISTSKPTLNANENLSSIQNQKDETVVPLLPVTITMSIRSPEGLVQSTYPLQITMPPPSTSIIFNENDVTQAAKEVREEKSNGKQKTETENETEKLSHSQEQAFTQARKLLTSCHVKLKRCKPPAAKKCLDQVEVSKDKAPGETESLTTSSDQELILAQGSKCDPASGEILQNAKLALKSSTTVPTSEPEDCSQPKPAFGPTQIAPALDPVIEDEDTDCPPAPGLERSPKECSSPSSDCPPVLERSTNFNSNLSSDEGDRSPPELECYSQNSI